MGQEQAREKKIMRNQALPFFCVCVCVCVRVCVRARVRVHARYQTRTRRPIALPLQQKLPAWLHTGNVTSSMSACGSSNKTWSRSWLSRRTRRVELTAEVLFE